MGKNQQIRIHLSFLTMVQKTQRKTKSQRRKMWTVRRVGGVIVGATRSKPRVPAKNTTEPRPKSSTKIEISVPERERRPPLKRSGSGRTLPTLRSQSSLRSITEGKSLTPTPRDTKTLSPPASNHAR